MFVIGLGRSFVAVEVKDPISGKYILYRSEAEHSADCNLHPFNQIPRRIFFDTSVVNTLVKYAPQVFEQEPLDPALESVLAEDIESLMHIVAVSGHGHWEFVSSNAMLEELSQTRSKDIREALLDYGVALVEVDCKEEEVRFREDFSRRVVLSSMLQEMPDVSDRVLLAHAIAMQCDVFCTRDRSTIVSKRSLLPKLNTRILTPKEWWAALRPWARLFA